METSDNMRIALDGLNKAIILTNSLVLQLLAEGFTVQANNLKSVLTNLVSQRAAIVAALSA